MSLIGSWTASSSACGVQVLDRLIRSSPKLWDHVTEQDTESDADSRLSTCRDIASVATCALASPCTVELVEVRMSRMRTWRKQLHVLLQDPGIKQRTDEWYHARTQLTTASDVGAAMGGRNGGKPTKEYLVKKAGGPDEQRAFSGTAPPLKWGIMFEPVAQQIYSQRMKLNVHEFGLIVHPTVPHIGASPDGISEMGVMLEIKCPFSRIIDGTVPSAYGAQIQCQLEVCGLDECDFFECMFQETEPGPRDQEDDGLERGILVEFWDDALKSHVYEYCTHIGSDSDRDVELRESWAADVIARMKGGAERPVIRRWRLKGFDIVRVVRDEEFIMRMKDSLDGVWKRVLRYRGDREAYRNEVLCGRRNTQATVSAPSAYAFVDE